MKEVKKNNFFKDILKSIKDFDKYEDFANEKIGKSLKYFIKLVLIFSIIVSIFNSLYVKDELKNLYLELKNSEDNFAYSNGVLKLESQEIVDINGIILIDTNDIENTKIEEYKNSGYSIILLKDKFIIVSNGVVETNYSDILNNAYVNKFTKQDIITRIDEMSETYKFLIIYIYYFTSIFIVYFIDILLNIVMLSILAYVAVRISRVNLKYSSAFGIAAHAITLPFILKLIYLSINIFTGFEIKYFNNMYDIISYIYIIVTILIIKSDFINRQMELMKIEEEHRKTKEKFECKEENKKEDNEGLESKKKKNKENKENKKDEDELDEKLNPSSAFKENNKNF